MQTMVSSHVWQRRTHRIIAMAVIIIGLTMMISTIPQCIYIGLIFIMLSLGWLAWIRMKEKKAEPPSPHNATNANVSPVLFLVASQNFTQRPGGPTPEDPNDKPPSYDQIVKLDGLPPDYFTIVTAKPPRYEDIEGIQKAWLAGIPSEELPTIHSPLDMSCSGCASDSNEMCSNGNALYTSVVLDVPSLQECSNNEFTCCSIPDTKKGYVNLTVTEDVTKTLSDN